MQYSLILLAVAVAIEANPVAVPQAVSAAISPSAPAPPGCTAGTSGTFGIAVYNATRPEVAKRQNNGINMKREKSAGEIKDGQVQAQANAPVSVISDGQIQAGEPTVLPIAQIGDGQVQAQTTAVAPITQISDGQVQAGLPKTVLPIAQIGDGQVQAHTTTVAPISQISDGQPQAPTEVPSTSTIPAVSQISDAQVQAPTNKATPTTAKQAVSQVSDAQVSENTSTSPASDVSGSGQTVACETEGSLSLTLLNGILKDAQGRTGYIASNYQFQFDDPPQAGAIYTSGFSTCANGTLALGGSNIFYQCLSGDFYNLYDRYWAAQCSPVYLTTVDLVACP